MCLDHNPQSVNMITFTKRVESVIYELLHCTTLSRSDSRISFTRDWIVVVWECPSIAKRNKVTITWSSTGAWVCPPQLGKQTMTGVYILLLTECNWTFFLTCHFSPFRKLIIHINTFIYSHVNSRVVVCSCTTRQSKYRYRRCHFYRKLQWLP